MLGLEIIAVTVGIEMMLGLCLAEVGDITLFSVSF